MAASPPPSDTRLARRIERHRGIAARDYEGEAVVITLENQSVHFLNDSAAALFRAIGDGPTTGRDLVAVLVKTYDVEESRAEADVLEFLDALEAKGIVILRDACVDAGGAEKR